jgi:3-isopropylmalate/(R)-2-methylmalate dehydratase small subunit
VSDADGLSYTFELDEFNTTKLLNGYDDISLTLLKEDKITAYEAAHPVVKKAAKVS